MITRPEPGAAETAARVAALGWRPVLAPALVLAPRPEAAAAALARPAAALLLASRAAARAFAPGAAGVAPPPVFAVGAGTAAEARARGFPEVAAAEGTATALAALVADRLDPATAGPLLLAVGEGYGQDLAAALRARGFRVRRRVVYAAAPARELPEPARAALQAGEVAAALFFSPRSVAATMALLRRAGLEATLARITALAISARVARALEDAAPPGGWRCLRIAAHPGEEAMLALLGPRRAAAAGTEPAPGRAEDGVPWLDEAPQRGAGSAGVA
nr:uroporphyrinogen-III synthase [Caldovatus aquaticus]